MIFKEGIEETNAILDALREGRVGGMRGSLASIGLGGHDDRVEMLRLLC
jgi:hypothetical protein